MNNELLKKLKEELNLMLECNSNTTLSNDIRYRYVTRTIFEIENGIYNDKLESISDDHDVINDKLRR